MTGKDTGAAGNTTALFAALEAAAYRFDFYQALRLLERADSDRPRWGRSQRPQQEVVRFGQEADLSFAPASLGSFCPAVEEDHKVRPPLLRSRLFGFLGPNGPLPRHLTELVIDRARDFEDDTFHRFLETFSHRLVTLFYRAWAQAQPHVNHDRPADDRFAIYVGSLIGLAPAAFRHRDSVSDAAKLFHAASLARHVRNADGLAYILGDFFGVPVRVEEFVGGWLRLEPQKRTYLEPGRAELGRGAVLGRRVWDRQHKCRIHIGPLTLKQYDDFLPKGVMLPKLVDWVRLYLSFELAWDARLVLRKEELPRLELGRGLRLGYTTWLGTRRSATDADDLCLDAEHLRQVGDRAA